MELKIALCLSGGLRNYKDTFYSIKHFLLDKHNIDVFFYGLENKEGKDKNIQDFTEMYNPKKIVVNDLEFYKKMPCRYKTQPNSYYAFYNVMKCNELKKEYELENNMKYDIVIRCRLDTFWFRSISQNEFELAKTKILTPREWSFNHVNSWARSDIFAIGSSDLMDQYSDLFNRIDEYCKSMEFYSEQICGYHMMINKIPTEENDRVFIFEYPTKEEEKHISPYVFIKYFESQKDRKGF